MYIDSHAHLYYGEKLNAEEIYNDFEKDNIKFVINASADLETSQISVQYASKFENIFAMVGVHPQDVDSFSEEVFKEIKKLAKHKKAVAIGEVGLDYHYDPHDKQKQAQVFLEFIKLSLELKLPLVVHVRDAYDDCFKILSEHKKNLKHGILFHCYSGTADFLHKCLAEFENAYFAFGGAITFKNAGGLIESVAECPLERLLIETDCPFLTPEPMRGKAVNEPKYLRFIYNKICDIKNINSDVLEKQVEENILRIFTKIKEFYGD